MPTSFTRFFLRQIIAVLQFKSLFPFILPIFELMVRTCFFLFFFWAIFSFSATSQTVGLLYSDSTGYPGYTLFGPSSSTTTYLIDPCGYLVNFWESAYFPGAVVYLEENGTMYRSCRFGANFNAGGAGGRVEKYNWEGDLIWSYNYSTSEYQQHHDIEVLPNGNILLLAWERKTSMAAIEAGRNPNQINNAGIWPEHIIEIVPQGVDQAEIVWEWHLWDHLIQDYDPDQNNFGDVAMHPELVDINYTPGQGNSFEDWIHANSIDYHPGLDQILISARNFNEVWVIDHSTTTIEAASHTGGNSGKGGDLLYRWGNPEAYKRGSAMDRMLFNQHDANWIADSLPGAGNILIYNNGIGRSPAYSTVDSWQPPVDPNGNYSIVSGQPFGPSTFTWTYGGEDLPSFFSPRISGAQRLPNGNTLICEGVNGRFFEVHPDGTLAWEYINPVGFNGITVQGDVPFGVDAFRAYKIAPDSPQLQGVDLSSEEPIEIEPLLYDCTLVDTSTVLLTTHLAKQQLAKVVQNPFKEQLLIEKYIASPVWGTIVNIQGQKVMVIELNDQTTAINTVNWRPGHYYLLLESADGIAQRPIPLIKS